MNSTQGWQHIENAGVIMKLKDLISTQIRSVAELFQNVLYNLFHK